MQKSISRGYLTAVLSAIALSTTPIFIRLLTLKHNLSPLMLAFWRPTFVALILFLLFLTFRRSLLHIQADQLLLLLFFGFVLACLSTLFSTSVALNGAAVSNVLVYCSTAFTALLGWWFLKERLSWTKIVAVVICLFGTVVVSQASDPAVWKLNITGILTGIFSGLAYAIYSLMGRTASQRGLNPWTTLFYTFCFGAIFMGIVNLLPINTTNTGQLMQSFMVLGTDFSGWGLLLLGAVPSILGFGLYNISLVHLPCSTVNLVATLDPVISAMTAFLILGERMTYVQAVGSLLILGGVVLMRAFEGRILSHYSTSDGTGKVIPIR